MSEPATEVEWLTSTYSERYYTPVLGLRPLCCTLCGALVPPDRSDDHDRWHRSISNDR